MPPQPQRIYRFHSQNHDSFFGSDSYHKIQIPLFPRSPATVPGFRSRPRGPRGFLRSRRSADLRQGELVGHLEGRLALVGS